MPHFALGLEKSVETSLVNKDQFFTLGAVFNASLAAAAEVSFTFTNSTIAATDVVVTAISSGATAGAYNTHVDAIAAGSCRISITNFSAGPLSEAIVINFVVIKGVSA